MTNEKIKGLANALRELSPEDRDLALAISRNEPTEPGCYPVQIAGESTAFIATVRRAEDGTLAYRHPRGGVLSRVGYLPAQWGPQIPGYDPAAHADMQLAWVTRADALPTLCGYEVCEEGATHHDAGGFGFCAFHFADTALSALPPGVRGELFSLYEDPAQDSEKIKGLQNSLAEAASTSLNLRTRVRRSEEAAGGARERLTDAEAEITGLRRDLKEDAAIALNLRTTVRHLQGERDGALVRLADAAKALRFGELREGAAAKELAEARKAVDLAKAVHSIESGQLSRARGILTEAGVANADALPVDVGVRVLADRLDETSDRDVPENVKALATKLEAQLLSNAELKDELEELEVSAAQTRQDLSFNEGERRKAEARCGSAEALRQIAAQELQDTRAKLANVRRINELNEERIATIVANHDNLKLECEDAVDGREAAEASLESALVKGRAAVVECELAELRHTKEMRDAGWTEAPTPDSADTPEPCLEFSEREWCTLCEAVGCSPLDSHATVVGAAVAARKVLTAAVKALRCVPECTASDLAEEARSLRAEIQAACEALAPYCDYCDPGKVSLAGVVDMLKSELLDDYERRVEERTADLWGQIKFLTGELFDAKRAVSAKTSAWELSKRIKTLAAYNERLARYSVSVDRPEDAAIYRAASQAIAKLTEPVEPSKDDEPAPRVDTPHDPSEGRFVYSEGEHGYDYLAAWEVGSIVPLKFKRWRLLSKSRLSAATSEHPATWAFVLEPLAEEGAD